MSAVAQNFRTDSAAVGPIANAASDMTGGDVFVILASIPATTTPALPAENFLYALGYDSDKNCLLLQGGLGVYLTGKTYDSATGYTLPYFKYKRPNSDGEANYDTGDNYYTVGVYSDGKATTKVGTLALDNTPDAGVLIVDTADTTNSNTLALNTDDAFSFPGLPSLLTGVGYYAPAISPSAVYYVQSNGVLSTTDSANYAGLPNASPKTNNNTIPPGTRFYMCPLSFVGTSSCTTNGDLTSNANANLVYYQCPRTLASTVPADLQAVYYTKYCGTNAKTGLTSTTLCELTNGTLPYYAYTNGKCGDKWPTNYSLSGMDGKLYTANSTYGMAYNGLCMVNAKTSPTGFKSLSLQDAFNQLVDEGDVKPPDNGSSSTPWWMWLLIVLLIVGIIILAVVLFMNMGKSSTKTEINAQGNLEQVTTEVN